MLERPVRGFAADGRGGDRGRAARSVRRRTRPSRSGSSVGTSRSSAGSTTGVERVREPGWPSPRRSAAPRGSRSGATNLAVLLDRVGRPAEALDVATTGWERARALGVERTYGGLLLADRREGRDRARVDGTRRTGSSRPGLAHRAGRRGRDPPAHPARPARHVPRRPGDGGRPRWPPPARRTRRRAAPRIEPRSWPPLAELAAIAGDVGRDARAAVDEGFAHGRRRPAGPRPRPARGHRPAGRGGCRGPGTRRDATPPGLEERAAPDRARSPQQVERIAAMLGVPADRRRPAAGRRRPGSVALTALCRAEARRVDERDDAVGLAGGRARLGMRSTGRTRRPMPGSARPARPSATGATRAEARRRSGRCPRDGRSPRRAAAAGRDRSARPAGRLDVEPRRRPSSRTRRGAPTSPRSRPDRSRARGPPADRRAGGRTRRSPTRCSSAARPRASTPRTSSTSSGRRTGPRPPRSRHRLGLSGGRAAAARVTRRPDYGVAALQLVEPRVGDPEVVGDLVVDGVGDRVREALAASGWPGPAARGRS